MVRKFLYFIAGLIALAIIGAIAFNIWSKEIARIAFVPTTEFVEQEPLAINAYSDEAMWFSRPGIEGKADIAHWQPSFRQSDAADTDVAGETASNTQEQAPQVAEAQMPADTSQIRPLDAGEASKLGQAPKPIKDYAVFFVHPTSYLDRGGWNAQLDDAKSQRFARLYVRGMASPFNRSTEIWAPRYRQATFGAFLTDQKEAQQALDAAYVDVQQAFRFFLESVDEDKPIVLAGHSQGSLHLLRLMREEIAGTPTADRIAALYAIGWPISVEKDLPMLALPACATPDQPGCVMSWSSFAEPADVGDIIEVYSTSIALDGTMRGDSSILCTNPLTGSIGGAAPAEQNLGTLVPSADLSTGELVPQSVPARCGDQGLLLIGDPPEMGSAVLPGNNYHVYDIPLFWRNLQEDVTKRVDAWHSAS